MTDPEATSLRILPLLQRVEIGWDGSTVDSDPPHPAETAGVGSDERGAQVFEQRARIRREVFSPQWRRTERDTTSLDLLMRSSVDCEVHRIMLEGSESGEPNEKNTILPKNVSESLKEDDHVSLAKPDMTPYQGTKISIGLLKMARDFSDSFSDSLSRRESAPEPRMDEKYGLPRTKWQDPFGLRLNHQWHHSISTTSVRPRARPIDWDRTSVGQRRTVTVREHSLPARLDGNEISAFPDIGAPANFIALDYVRSRHLLIKAALQPSMKTAVGSAVSIMGTVTLPFSFKGEKTSHELEFNVMRKAVHEVILGSPFLSLTKTFTNHVHRLQQKLREIRLPRICFLGLHQYVSGRVNGNYVDAVPDTGADVPVMSLALAQEHGYVVDSDLKHQILLEFADGTTARSLGLVKDLEWQYGSSEALHRIDVYVLEELQTDFILDNTFLHDTNAFVAHEEDFWTDDGNVFDGGWMISIIKLVDSVLKGSRRRKSSSPAITTESLDEAWMLEKSRQLNAYSLAKKQAQGMTEDQQRVFLEPHLAQLERFLQTRPSRGSASQSSLSQVPSSTSVPVTASKTTGRPSFFSRLRGPKRKASEPAVNGPMAV